MPLEAESSPRGLFARNVSLIFPVLIVTSVLVIVAPLPPVLMDLLLACNVTIAVVILAFKYEDEFSTHRLYQSSFEVARPWVTDYVDDGRFLWFTTVDSSGLQRAMKLPVIRLGWQRLSESIVSSER